MTMKLSEAMRKGIECSLPAKGFYLSKGVELANSDAPVDALCACALGAALLGAFECDFDMIQEECDSEYPNIKGYHEVFLDIFPDINSIRIENPIRHSPSGYKPNLWNVVTDLNDHAAWTREQIADWLESIGY